MQTIAILPESPTTLHSHYRATCGNHYATGQTAGQALDTLEAELDTTSTATGETLVILQRFRPDDLFSKAQQQRLRELMDQFHTAINQGTQLPSSTQTELETLIEAELEANIQRSQRLLQQRDQIA
jgi:pyruvate kinase